MIGHLKNIHPDRYKEREILKSSDLASKKRKLEFKLKPVKASPGVRKAEARQETMDKYGYKTKPWKDDDPRHKAACSALVGKVFRDLQPFSITEDEGFIR